MENHPSTREIYVQYGDEKGNTVYVRSHFVWDESAFMKARFEECQKNRRSEEYKTGDVTQVQTIDRAQYLRLRG